MSPKTTKLRDRKREERTDTGYRIHSDPMDAIQSLTKPNHERGVLRGVRSSYERSPKVLYGPWSRPYATLANNNPNPSLFEAKHELRRATIIKIRIAAARTALDTPERMIPYREFRRLATEIGTLANPRTIDGYIQTLLDAEYFELTFDRENVRLLQIPVELGYDAIAPKTPQILETSQESKEI